ncbi:MAG: hypothetical protein LC126_09230 [Bryobacterales bacterium]|nr:hypothetical protein [Bryobacterales bacterium]
MTSQDTQIRNILGARFRANPEYQLIPFERLPAGQREQWKELARDPSFFGLLLPREGSACRMKSACRDTALLFFTMQSAGVLPAFAVHAGNGEANRTIAQLVLDGILEIEANGEFFTGPAAASRIFPETKAEASRHPLAGLSADAVRYGASLDSLDAGQIAARLYFYNRIPLTARWRTLYATKEAVLAHLGAKDNPVLRRDWMELPADPENNAWISWRRRSQWNVPVDGQTYKLYLSPRPDHLTEAFRAFVSAISGAGCLNFKAGSDAGALLRPDKLVAYFHSKEDLDDAAARLECGLAGCPAQGVPFTAPSGDSLLVSWGIDPPAEEWERRESWRLWVTKRLAVHIKAGSTARPAVDPVKFALERMRLEAVDTSIWTPAPGIWKPGE